MKKLIPLFLMTFFTHYTQAAPKEEMLKTDFTATPTVAHSMEPIDTIADHQSEISEEEQKDLNELIDSLNMLEMIFIPENNDHE